MGKQALRRLTAGPRSWRILKHIVLSGLRKSCRSRSHPSLSQNILLGQDIPFYGNLPVPAGSHIHHLAKREKRSSDLLHGIFYAVEDIFVIIHRLEGQSRGDRSRKPDRSFHEIDIIHLIDPVHRLAFGIPPEHAKTCQKDRDQKFIFTSCVNNIQDLLGPGNIIQNLDWEIVLIQYFMTHGKVPRILLYH